ncbi:MAG: hypothetical protein ABWY55_01470, partial [Microbacterium sp.]
RYSRLVVTPRWIRRFAAAALCALALGLAVPSAAHADEGDCTQFIDSPDRWLDDEDTREYFSPPVEVIPPPMLPFWGERDCATKDIADSMPSDDGLTIYTVHFVDVPYTLYVDMMAEFQEQGWFETLGARQLDEANAVVAEPLDVDDLAAISPDPWIVQAQFLRDGDDTVQASWSREGAGADADLSAVSVTLFLESTFGPAAGGTSFADPSVLSSLRTIAEALPNAVQSTVIGVGAIVLMLLIGVPGVLLDSVIGPRYEAAAARWRARRRAPAEPRRAPSWLIWPGFVVAAVIAGFVDPAFGWNGMSARVVISGLLSFAALNVAGWMLVRVLIRRSVPDSDPRMVFRWGSLVLLALSVLVARLIGFEPGVIFGLVAGLTFAIALAASRDALVILVGSGIALVVALVGWAAYSLLSPLADAAPGNAMLVLVTEFASGLTIEGVSTLPIALLPLLALDGAALYAWRRWVWAIAYVIGLGAFMLVLLTIPDSWATVGGDFSRWVLLLVGFAVVAIAVWGINALLERRRKPLDPVPGAAESETDEEDSR